MGPPPDRFISTKVRLVSPTSCVDRPVAASATRSRKDFGPRSFLMKYSLSDASDHFTDVHPASAAAPPPPPAAVVLFGGVSTRTFDFVATSMMRISVVGMIVSPGRAYGYW